MNRIIIVITLKDCAWLSYRVSGEIVELRSLFTGTVEQMIERVKKAKTDEILVAAYSTEILREFRSIGVDTCYWLGRFRTENFVRWNGIYESSRAKIRESPAIQFKSLLSDLSLTFSAQTMSAATACKLLMAWQEFNPPAVGSVSRE